MIRQGRHTIVALQRHFSRTIADTIRATTKSTKRYSTNSYHDIKSYLSYAKFNKLSTKSTSFRGKFYELQTKKALQDIFNVKEGHININGGAYDQGIDIIAKWDLSQYAPNSDINYEEKTAIGALRDSVAVQGETGGHVEESNQYADLLIQCKATSRKVPSRILRELLGAYSRHVTAQNKDRLFPVLASNNVLTSDALKFFTSVEAPMLFLQIELSTHQITEKAEDEYQPENYQVGNLVSYFRNPAAKELLHGLSDYEIVNLRILKQLDID